jgi:hypothetical protein
VASYLGDADQYEPGLHRLEPPGNLAVRRLEFSDLVAAGLYRQWLPERAAGNLNATVDNAGNPLPGVNIVPQTVNAATDPAHIGLDPSVQQVLSSMPQPNNYTIGDGLKVAGFSWLAAEHEKQLDYTIRVDHTFNANHNVFVR